MMTGILGLKMAQFLRKEELKFATIVYGGVCVEMGLISLMHMLPAKLLVYQVFLLYSPRLAKATVYRSTLYNTFL